jgi:hypothetical protein
MAGLYDAGDIVRLQATYRASGGAPIAPASVYCLVRPPGGAVTTYRFPNEIASVNTGGFYLDILASQVGIWAYRFSGHPSAGMAAGEDVFSIKPSAFIF